MPAPEQLNHVSFQALYIPTHDTTLNDAKCLACSLRDDKQRLSKGIITQQAKMWQFVHSAWFYEIAASWNISEKKQKLERKPPDSQSARAWLTTALYSGWLPKILDKLDRDADEDAVSHLPGCPITAALPSSPSSLSNELRISRSVIYAMYSPTSPRSQQSRTGFIKTL